MVGHVFIIINIQLSFPSFIHNERTEIRKNIVLLGILTLNGQKLIPKPRNPSAIEK